MSHPPFPPFYSRKYNAPFRESGNKFICNDIVVDVNQGIPRFACTNSYASLFGDQWKQYKKTQLDSHTGLPLSESRLLRCFADEMNNLEGKVALEAGCGAGRFTEILLKMKLKLVSSDISSAVEVNAENFPISEDHLVIQADINDMPYQDESFDVVICLGVIQHTPNPEETIKNLYGLTKKGGTLIIDHYTFSKAALFRLAPIYRFFLKRKKPVVTIPYTRKLVKFYLPLHKKVSGSKLLSVLLNRVSPVISYYRTLPKLDENHQEQWALLDTHDSLTDWYKHFRSKESIKETLKKLGALDIRAEYNGNGVEARCKKPL